MISWHVPFGLVQNLKSFIYMVRGLWLSSIRVRGVKGGKSDLFGFPKAFTYDGVSIRTEGSGPMLRDLRLYSLPQLLHGCLVPVGE